MGTPGDKAKLGKVVQGSLDPEEAPPPLTPEPQPSTSSSTEMGLISRLPQFEPFGLHPTLPHATTKPESFLEQAHIEDYFAQSKYYPENISEKTFLDLDQPGPSGLQIPKSKSLSKIGGKKRGSQKTSGHTCSVCQKNFASVEKLGKHQQVHSAASPFKCEHCKKSFSSKFKLVRHRLIHSDRKPFSCTVCERTFHRKDHLKNHVKVHSPSKQVYVCEKAECKKEYTSLMSFRKHQALHSAEEGSLQCQICNNVFSSKEEILYHLKIHAGSRTVKNPNEKKFTCEHCDRKFFTKKDVRRHLVVHTGMRDFLCQFCPQRFGRKDHLVRHIKKSHSKNVPPEDLETAIKSEIPETVVKPDVVVVKPEPEVKTEFVEEPEFFSLEDILSPLDDPFLPPGAEGTFLPSTSSQELKDLGSIILEDIVDEGILSQSVLTQSEIQRLLEPSEEKNLPLPGFSQTFQPPPPP